MRNTQCFSKKISGKTLRQHSGGLRKPAETLRQHSGGLQKPAETLRLHFERIRCIKETFRRIYEPQIWQTAAWFTSNKTLCLQNLAFPKHSSYICGQI